MNVNNIAITSIESITAFDAVSGAYRFTLDELQNATLSQSQETTDITGSAGRKLSSLKRNKSVTISGTNGMVSSGLLEVQTGNSFESKNTTIMWNEVRRVTTYRVGSMSENRSYTTYVAVGTEGSEIENLFILNSDGSIGAKLIQNSEVTAENEFTYDPETRKIVLHSSIADGANIVVYYTREIAADVLTNTSDAFSGKLTLYVDMFGEDKCANLYRIQVYIPKADFSGEFSFEMGDNQTVHSFEAQALAGACGAGGNLWSYIVFGADEADAQ